MLWALGVQPGEATPINSQLRLVAPGGQPHRCLSWAPTGRLGRASSLGLWGLAMLKELARLHGGAATAVLGAGRGTSALCNSGGVALRPVEARCSSQTARKGQS